MIMDKLPDFLEKHSDFECIFFDFELKKLSRSFDEIYEILKGIRKRVARKETVKIAKSTFDYARRVDELNVSPQSLYCFKCNAECVTVEYDSKLKTYGVHSAYTPLTVFDDVPKKYKLSSASFIACDSLEDAVMCFYYIVKKFCNRFSYDLF